MKIFFFLFIGSLNCIYANTLSIRFAPTFHQLPLKTNYNYIIHTNDTIQVNDLKWYVSSVKLLNKHQPVFIENNSYHLIHVVSDSSLHFELNINDDLQFDELEFTIGIDSITNVSGVMGGALDPVNGMYWTWQSGYINFKIEGTGSACTSKRKNFAIHLGGYAHPYPTTQLCRFQLKKADEIIILFEVDTFLSSIDYINHHHVMSPGKDAKHISDKLGSNFKLKSE